MTGAATNLGDLVDRSGPPDRPLLVGFSPAGEPETMTRAGLDARADAFARGLLRGGIARGERIAILSANRPDTLAALLGAMRAGVVPVPVNHKFPPATVAAVLADCGARLVLCDGPRRAALPPLAPGVGLAAFDGEGPEGFSAWLDPGPFVPITPEPDEAALFLYTSGSTGRPKGVRLSHASHLWVARTRAAETDLRGERLLVAAPLYHMNALALALLVCAAGATMVLLPQVRGAELHRGHRPPPMHVAHRRAADDRHDAAGEGPPRLQRPHRRADGADGLGAGQRHPGPPDPRPAAERPHPQRLRHDRGRADRVRRPSGRPAHARRLRRRPRPDVAIRLVGPDAPGAGVLQMRSPAIMLGYHNRPDVPVPITPDGFYDTGDVFRRDAEGFHYFLGRTDDMFVSGGENIFPGEVELVLERHADVLQSCVVPVEDAIKGTKPVAFVVRRPGATLDEAGIKAHALAHAPAYQHPRRVWFVEALPLASTNKIDRATLRLRAEAAMRTQP